MSYTRVNWQDAPSVSTPLSASNLNKMDAGIKQNADDIETLQQHTYDSALDDSSTNAPQTKVVKKAIDDAMESVTIITDPTLSNEGQAADAKATGEAVAQVKSAIDALKITDTASGAIASFPDGAAMPMENLSVEMSPIQNLNGQDAPYPGGGGKNLLNPDVVVGENKFIYAANGEATSPSATGGTWRYSEYIPVTPGDVLYFGEVNASASGAGSAFYSEKSTSGYISGFNATQLANANNVWTVPSGAAYMRHSWRIDTGYNVEWNTSVYIVKNTDPHQWSPYSNICPITGWTQLEVTRCGANQWDGSYEPGGINDSTGEDATVTTQNGSGYITVASSADYYINASDITSAGGVYVYYYDSEKAFIGRAIRNGYNVANKTITTPSNCRYIRFKAQPATYDIANKLSINYPATDTEYHAYNGQSATIQLGQTVYGGTLDVIGGELANSGVLETITTVDGVIESEHFKNYSASVGVLENCVRLTLSRKPTTAGLNVDSNSYAIKMCSMLPHAFSYASDTPHWYINNQMYIFLPVSVGTTIGAVAAWLAEHPIQIYIPYATPQTITTDPVSMSTIKGQNNVWSDADSVTVEYVCDPKLYIARLTEPDADMVADANITSGSYFMVGNSLYLATSNIASGANIVPGVNCTRTNLASALNAINA